GTSLESAEGGIMRLSSGEEFAATTLVWTTGVRPHALAARSGFPVDDRGRVTCDEYLRVHDADGGVVPDPGAAGDNAAVPDRATSSPSARCSGHARRSAAPPPKTKNGGAPADVGNGSYSTITPSSDGSAAGNCGSSRRKVSSNSVATAMSRTHFRSPGTIHHG